MNDRDRDRDRDVILGRKYGYPECCIREFASRDLAPDEQRKFCGTGYIPCAKCNAMSEEEILDGIASRRQYEQPFPNDEWGDRPFELVVRNAPVEV